MFEDLLEDAHKECVEVVSIPLKGKLKGLYYDKTIAINKNTKSTAEKTCVLAEELGHYYTTAGNILDQKISTNRKLERRALAWAFRRLVPLDKLIEAFEAGIRSRHELAEYLQVTEKFLDAALKYYKEKHGFHYRIGEYWICFEPLGIIENIDNFF
jgi:Zn-dependent peptidase ImmA (M78 family)